jgi:hypothetical protein
MRGRVQALIELSAGQSDPTAAKISTSVPPCWACAGEVDGRWTTSLTFRSRRFYRSPCSNYSSGMKVRLGFAIAINIPPECDHRRGVVGGDAASGARPSGRWPSCSIKTCTHFISHNGNQVIGITERTLWLDHGRMVMLDESALVCSSTCSGADGQRRPCRTALRLRSQTDSGCHRQARQRRANGRTPTVTR